MKTSSFLSTASDGSSSFAASSRQLRERGFARLCRFAATGVLISLAGCSSDDPLAPPVEGTAGAAGSAGGGSGGRDAGADAAGGAGGATTAGGAAGATTSGGAGGTTTAGGASGASGASGGAAGSGAGGALDASRPEVTSDGPMADGVSVDAISSDASVDRGGASDADLRDVTNDAPVTKPPCMTSPNQVAVLGDSYVNWISHTFPADLAREAGVTYRLYAVGGTAMGSGGIGLIPPQLDQAITADPNIIALVMDGGGNDVLVADTAQFPQGADCKNNLMSPSIADCQKIVQKAVDAAIGMMDKAAEKGVKDIVYFFYPHVPEGTLVGGAHPNAILDYAIPKVKATCDEARTRTQGKLTCHFLDLIPVFDGHPDWFALTDIHPNPTGSAAMAKAVWSIMKDKCIAQPASSGCCTP